MIHHVGIGVGDFAKSRAFYTAALAPLGYGVVKEFGDSAGFGDAEGPRFWIHGSRAAAPEAHVCFEARSRAEVRAFYAAAMAAGGRDHGAPEVCTEYRPDYYAAYVFDPDGVNVQALCLSFGE